MPNPETGCEGRSRVMRAVRVALAAPLLVAPPAGAQSHAPPASRASRSAPAHDAYVDPSGVIRWRDTGAEVALFGANYTLPSSSDYRAAGYLGLDRHRLVDDDLAHFARLGWDGMRLALWGDWENTDRAGNLVANAHLDLLDYALAKARERGISVLLSPIQTYQSNWPDALGDSTAPGFSRYFQKSALGTSDSAIAAQTNYLRQLLNHVNPYTHTAIKDEPAIVFVEMINEPTHHSEDLAGSVRYIDALAAAVRATGCTKILFHNVSQEFGIAEAIRRSTVQGATFGWYPTGLNSGHELRGNYLRTVDDYPPMRTPVLAGRPRIVYEFDSPDLRTGYMYPAMARTFRSVGAQFATMFAYDMLGTASRNLGWQTHYLNLIYTPRKAMSAVIAAEAMRRLPRGQAYGAYPANTRFGDFHVDADENLGELVAPDAFLYAGSTRSVPPQPAQLQRIAGYGSSSVVTYPGEGLYFLDKVRDGVWRLEVYPDAVPIRDPFEPPSRDKIVTRALAATWPMTVRLPDLGPSFAVQAVAGPTTTRASTASGGRFMVRPGVYVLSARGPVARATLPAFVGRVRFGEYHGPPADTAPLTVALLPHGDQVAGQPFAVAAHVVDSVRPSAVTLWVRPTGTGRFRPYPMQPAAAYEYRAALAAGTLGEGVYEYAISVAHGDSVVTFPEGLHRRPTDWDFDGQQFWTTRVVRPEVALRLFAPAEDAVRMAFTRIGDGGRQGLFRLVPTGVAGAPVFHVELPVAARRPLDDYTASLVVEDRVAARGTSITRASGLTLRARALTAGQRVHVTLVEHDGTSWGAVIALDTAWAEHTVSLADLRPVRSAMLPEGFPGEWNYWLGPASGRGGAGDTLRRAAIERLQLSLRAADVSPAATAPAGVEVESVALTFPSDPPRAP